MVTRDSDNVFKALADPTRREILSLLDTEGLPVSDLSQRFPVSRPAISKHLRLLRESGLVFETRRGRQRIYQLNREPLELVVRWLEGYQAEEADSGQLDLPAADSPRPTSEDADWKCW
jgi:DNA-binding transcriptional ArsR family regulator